MGIDDEDDLGHAMLFQKRDGFSDRVLVLDFNHLITRRAFLLSWVQIHVQSQYLLVGSATSPLAQNRYIMHRVLIVEILQRDRAVKYFDERRPLFIPRCADDKDGRVIAKEDFAWQPDPLWAELKLRDGD